MARYKSPFRYVQTFKDRPGTCRHYLRLPGRKAIPQEGGELVADTLEDVRAMLPRGLTRRRPAAALGRDVIETWD